MNCPNCKYEICGAAVLAEGARIAGSVRSKAKTLANRRNAALPRPGALGKKKPRKINKKNLEVSTNCWQFKRSTKQKK
jgi:hypothetical protein